MFKHKQKGNVKKMTVFSVVSGLVILSLVVLVSVLIITLGPPSNRMDETFPMNTTLPLMNTTLPPMNETLPPCQSLWIQRGSRLNASAFVDGETDTDDRGFGISTSISSDSNIVVVGSNRYYRSGSASGGRTLIFEYDGSNWIQRGSTIEGTQLNEENGFSVSISSDGNIIATGSPRADGVSIDSGFVRLFNYDGNDWGQSGSIDGLGNNDNNGYSVSLSADGNVVATGSRKTTVGVGDGSMVRVFEYDGNNWVQRGSNLNWEDILDATGASVSLSSDGNTVAFGAPQNGFGPGGRYSGATRIFYYDGNDWVQRGSNIFGESYGDQSGYTVSLSSDGNTVATAAPENDNVISRSGHVRIFNWDGNDWIQRGTNINGTFERGLSGRGGMALSADGNTVAIGSPFADDINGPFSGNVRVFKWDLTSMDWVQQGLDFSGEEENGQTGKSVSLSPNGDTVVISTPNAQPRGYVRIFDLVCI